MRRQMFISFVIWCDFGEVDFGANLDLAGGKCLAISRWRGPGRGRGRLGRFGFHLFWVTLNL